MCCHNYFSHFFIYKFCRSCMILELGEFLWQAQDLWVVFLQNWPNVEEMENVLLNYKELQNCLTHNWNKCCYNSTGKLERTFSLLQTQEKCITTLFLTPDSLVRTTNYFSCYLIPYPLCPGFTLWLQLCYRLCFMLLERQCGCHHNF